MSICFKTSSRTLVLLFLLFMAQKTGVAQKPMSAASTSPASASSTLDGTWTGSINQDKAVNGLTNLTLSIDVKQKGNDITGCSRVTASDKQYYAIMKVTGTLTNGTLHYSETAISEQRPAPNTYWCLKKGDLNLSKDGNELTGKWDDAGCNAGTVHLHKQATVIIFIGGFFDHSLSKIVGTYQANFLQSLVSTEKLNTAYFSGVDVEYFTWDQTEEVKGFIRRLPPESTIALIGHSYGGDTAALVTVRCGRKIDLLITADPVSRVGVGSTFGPSYKDVSTHSGVWIDINAVGAGSGNIIAGIGGAWDAGPKPWATIYYEADSPHAGFQGMLEYSKKGGKSAEEALFDFVLSHCLGV